MGHDENCTLGGFTGLKYTYNNFIKAELSSYFAEHFGSLHWSAAMVRVNRPPDGIRSVIHNYLLFSSGVVRRQVQRFEDEAGSKAFAKSTELSSDLYRGDIEALVVESCVRDTADGFRRDGG